MWLDIIKERLKELGYTYKFVAQESKVAERTVSRIFAGKTPSPYADTLDRIGKVLGLSLADILADTKTVVGGKNYIELNEEHEFLTAEANNEALCTIIEKVVYEKAKGNLAIYFHDI